MRSSIWNHICRQRIRACDQTTRQFSPVPANRKRIRNNAPFGRRGLSAVVRTKAGTFAFVTRGVPARWSAFLMGLIRLDRVTPAISIYALRNDRIEPRLRSFPTLESLVPLRFTLAITPEPSAIVWRKWDANHQRVAAAAAIDDWNPCLPPDLSRRSFTRIQGRHGHSLECSSL